MTQKQTALYEEHLSAKAKIVPFAGWMMPVSYEGVLAEHHTVRQKAGMFDVSHMGEIRVTGKNAFEFLQYLTMNNLDKISDGQGQYSGILNNRGGMIDDLIIYRLEKDNYFICVNASNILKDYQWIREHADKFEVQVSNESERWSQIAVQGPNSKAAVNSLVGWKYQDQFNELPYMSIMSIGLFGKTALLARTGYTGEHGYEIYMPNDLAKNCWVALLETAPFTGIKPIGLGARDTLRLEACYLLYGQDMTETVTPLEADVAWAVKFDCGEFIGRDALLKQKEEGIPRKLICFKLEETGVPRHDMNVLTSGEEIGKVTSGSVLPTSGGAGGMALVKSNLLKERDIFEVDIRGTKKKAVVTKKPFYQAKTK